MCFEITYNSNHPMSVALAYNEVVSIQIFQLVKLLDIF